MFVSARTAAFQAYAGETTEFVDFGALGDSLLSLGAELKGGLLSLTRAFVATT